MCNNQKIVSRFVRIIVVSLFSSLITLAVADVQPSPPAPASFLPSLSTSPTSTPAKTTITSAASSPATVAAAPSASSYQMAPPNAAPIPKAQSLQTIIPTPPDVNAKAFLLIDANSGYIIAQKNADVPLPPASLTKLMTMYVTSGVLKSGRIKLSDPITVSESAWRTGGSRMFIQVGTQVPVSDLVNGIVVASGNDACIALAEHIAGTESSFVDLMNKTAAQLGMQKTHYADATGLPDPKNYTTAYDLATLSRAIIQNYPDDYKWYSQKWMFFNNIKQPNRNLLLWRDPSVDGLKTGHTEDAGYCLAASAKRSDMRLIAIVLGSPSIKQRATDVEALLNYGFRFFQTRKIYAQNTLIEKQRTWYGKEKTTPLGLQQDFYVTLPVGHDIKQLKTVVNVPQPFRAPIVKNQPYGTLDASINNQTIASQPLVALADNPQAWAIGRLFDHVSLLFQRWFHSA